MEVNYKVSECPAPDWFGYSLFSDKKEFIEAVEANERVYVYTKFNTKTTLDVSLYFKGFMSSININHGDFKLHKKSSYSFTGGCYTDKYYFKLLKNQGYDEFVEYVLGIISEFVTKKPIEVIFYDTEVMKVLKFK